MSQQTIRVWDPVVRVFHWSLAGAFLIAYLSEDDFLSLHSFAGYTVLGLLLIRLLWGLIGTRHARFTDFVRPPGEALGYLKDSLLGRAKRYLGHNPAGGLMIIAMLLSLLFTTITGIATLGVEEGAGPLAGMMGGAPRFIAKATEEVHEFFANFTLLLVLGHLIGVLFESVVHRENLVRAMISGDKPLRDGESQ
ncbi:MAG: cytochrome b/b6 domain-containing protein [Chromatiales bacterium]|nr:cytochrome b/b6 domain-containing protein [Gammaproteobacteria bacterium]MBW6477626.1 cytochrome b/b6 domain-containing protein [Chromatiales bacterium]